MDAREQEPADGSTSRRRVGGRDLPVAIAVGLALATLFLGSLFWHAAAFTGVIALLTVVAYVETAHVLRGVGIRLQQAVLIVATLVMLFGAYQARHAGQVVGLVVLFLGGVLWLLADAERRDATRALSITMLFGVWVGLFASFGVLLVNSDGGVEAALLVIGAAIFTDIGGYAFGVSVGRTPIAPSVSPNKTWEGLLGGLLVAVGLAAVVMPLLGEVFSAGQAAIVAALCGLAGFLGDLVESMFKRDLGVKDLGEVLPGHGGVLDRVDGILLALPVGFYAVQLVLHRL